MGREVVYEEKEKERRGGEKEKERGGKEGERERGERR